MEKSALKMSFLHWLKALDLQESKRNVALATIGSWSFISKFTSKCICTSCFNNILDMFYKVQESHGLKRNVLLATFGSWNSTSSI